MSVLLQDLRYGCRMLARNPGFTVLAVLTLAVGIGATTAIFSFVYAILLRPLGFADSQRLVMLQTDQFVTSPGDFLEWQERSRAFADMTAFTGSSFSLTGGGEPERLMAAMVTSRFFETLGVAPVLGRTLAPPEGQTFSTDAVVISAGLWRRRFESSPDIVGSPITLDGTPFTVAGVMPDGFTFPRDIFGSWGGRMTEDLDLWVPLTLRPGERSNAFLRVVARLKPEVSEEQAGAEMATITREIDRTLPGNRRLGVSVIPLHDVVVREVRRLLLLFLGAVSFLLLIACTNVANLLLGRGAARQREVAIRAALGSGRRRLIRQFLTESVLLAALGGIAGLLMAVWSLDALAAFIPAASLPRLHEVTIDTQVLLFTLAISVGTGLAFGMVPALRSSKADITSALKAAGSTHTPRSRLLSLLVVSEMTLAFVLLAGAALLVESFLRLTSVEPGFHADSLHTASVSLPESSYSTMASLQTFSAEVLERLRRSPGIARAGAVNWLPLGSALIMGDFTAEDVAKPPAGLVVAKPAVSSDYFQTMMIPVLEGRAFTERDGAGAPGVAIVSEEIARQLWPGQSVLGKRLKIGFGSPSEQQWLSMVGVVGEVKQSALSERSRPAIYVPLTQAAFPFLLRSLTFVVRTSEASAGVASLVRRTIRDVDPALPLDRVATMRQLLESSVSEPRFRAAVMGGFAATALLLVAIGILGVLVYSVTRRTREIGVRMALGAERVDVQRLVVREALGMAVVGVALGTIAALGLTRLLTRFLFEVRPVEPMAFIVASALITAVALVASYVPTLRATRVDPLVALRAE
ncbi:MAG: ABC transporter permease [Vicinamibacterales bacterium]